MFRSQNRRQYLHKNASGVHFFDLVNQSGWYDIMHTYYKNAFEIVVLSVKKKHIFWVSK